MSTKRIVSLLLLLFGEAIIIVAFILFGGDTANNIFGLNLGVSLFVFGLLSLNYGAPWIDLKDNTQKQIGALGINWFVISTYAFVTVLTMILSNVVWELSFKLQLILQCVWLFLLLLGMSASRYASDKVNTVYVQEAKNRRGIQEMRTAMRQLKDKIVDLDGLPQPFLHRINALEENLRFISPSNNSEAYELEQSFVETTDSIKFAISDYSMNEERVESDLKKLERIYQYRKNINSN
ncbi:MAG: hypothetical protein LUH10_14170 [Tannerellaceae bacterium]|nr:hypothetical protein [Tannerellaceae bacterium]